MLLWGTDLPSPALGTKAPAASTAWFFAHALLCRGLLQQTPTWIYGLQMGLIQTTWDTSQQLSWISRQEWSLASFYLQYRHSPKVSLVNNFGTFFAVVPSTYGGSMLLIQHTHSCRKLGMTETPSYALYSLQGRHLEKQKTSATVKRF